jgi:hypothetical protein
LSEILRGDPRSPIAMPSKVLHDQTHVVQRPDASIRSPGPEAFWKFGSQRGRARHHLMWGRHFRGVGGERQVLHGDTLLAGVIRIKRQPPGHTLST